MKHRLKKIKVKGGKDANKMLLRKLVKNFIIKGKITTTLTKAKLLKSLLEKIIYRIRENNDKNKKYVVQYIGNNKHIVNFLFENVGLVFKEIVGGYVKIINLSERMSDGSPMAQVVWSKPVVFEEINKKKKGKKEKGDVNKVKKEQG